MRIANIADFFANIRIRPIPNWKLKAEGIAFAVIHTESQPPEKLDAIAKAQLDNASEYHLSRAKEW